MALVPRPPSRRPRPLRHIAVMIPASNLRLAISRYFYHAGLSIFETVTSLFFPAQRRIFPSVHVQLLTLTAAAPSSATRGRLAPPPRRRTHFSAYEPPPQPSWRSLVRQKSPPPPHRLLLHPLWPDVARFPGRSSRWCPSLRDLSKTRLGNSRCF